MNVLSLLSTPPIPERCQLIRVARQAMATRFEVVLPLLDPKAGVASEAALDLIDELESQMTVYREDSEVSRLNQHAPIRPIPVEARLFEMFQRAGRIHRDTQGAFDIASGSLIKAWGFYRRQGRVPRYVELADALKCAGMRHVLLDAKTTSVKFRRPGVEINLGAIGKGYALDRAAMHLQTEYFIQSAVLNGGHSSIRVLDPPPGMSAWRLDLRHPWRAGELLGTFNLSNCGLGTSAASFQYFEHDGRKLGHLLDPRVGRPAEGMALVSVKAPMAETADALSTAFFVGGVQMAREYCRRHPEVGAVLLTDGGEAEPVTLNLPPHEFRILK